MFFYKLRLSNIKHCFSPLPTPSALEVKGRGGYTNNNQIIKNITQLKLAGKAGGIIHNNTLQALRSSG